MLGFGVWGSGPAWAEDSCWEVFLSMLQLFGYDFVQLSNLGITKFGLQCCKCAFCRGSDRLTIRR